MKQLALSAFIADLFAHLIVLKNDNKMGIEK